MFITGLHPSASGSKVHFCNTICCLCWVGEPHAEVAPVALLCWEGAKAQQGGGPLPPLLVSYHNQEVNAPSTASTALHHLSRIAAMNCCLVCPVLHNIEPNCPKNVNWWDTWEVVQNIEMHLIYLIDSRNRFSKSSEERQHFVSNDACILLASYVLQHSCPWADKFVKGQICKRQDSNTPPLLPVKWGYWWQWERWW